jgi:hypothetical protein
LKPWRDADDAPLEHVEFGHERIRGTNDVRRKKMLDEYLVHIGDKEGRYRMRKALDRLRELRNPESFVGRFAMNFCVFYPICFLGQALVLFFGIGNGIGWMAFYSAAMAVTIGLVRGITTKPGRRFWGADK